VQDLQAFPCPASHNLTQGPCLPLCGFLKARVIVYATIHQKRATRQLRPFCGVLKNYLSIYARSRLQKLTRKVQKLTSTPLRFFSYRQQDPLPVSGIAAPRLVCGSWVLGLCPNKRRRVRGYNRRTACRVFIAINTLLATSQKQKKGTACPSLYNKHF
jgi:hypothetical protein